MKTVVVTGATGGVGRAIVRRMIERGWEVFPTARDREMLRDLGPTAIELDLTDPDTIERARDTVAAAVCPSGLQGLVNGAGISVDGPVELLTLDGLRQQFEVNVVGQVAVTQAFLPLLRAGRGRIVNMGGAAGRLPLPMYGALSASKAALDALTTALRMELRHQGVAVSYIEPGALDTAFFERSAEAAARRGYAGDAKAQRRYARALEASAKALAESPASPADAAVAAVVKALVARHPAARYVVGARTALALRLLPRLPAGLQDRLVMSSLGLGRSAFGSAGDKHDPRAAQEEVS
jgi:NAD(P)-dependent dehydrogenase (short-subunit alcohol dehydrogenase family)